jgi:hypothetical protein
MELIINILLAVFSAVLGVLIGWFIAEPQRLPKWIALNKRTNWKGTWCCAWFPKLPDDKVWVMDKVQLSHKLGKLHIKSYESSEGYDWEASLSIKGFFLIGEWKSLKPNSTSRGTMQLKISNQGDVIYGICTGPHIDEHMVSYKFVFSETEKSLHSTIEKFESLI